MVSCGRAESVGSSREAASVAAAVAEWPAAAVAAEEAVLQSNLVPSTVRCDESRSMACLARGVDRIR